MRSYREICEGVRYNCLTPLNKEPYNGREETWLCRCDCGRTTKATKSQLLRGGKKSCGCSRKKSPPNMLDLSGQRFGRLVAIRISGRTKNLNVLWLCKCDCGNEVLANATSLRRGDTVSCGCALQDQIMLAADTLRERYTVDGVVVPALTRKTRADSKSGHKGIYVRRRKDRVFYEVNIAVKGKRYFASCHSLADAIKKRAELEERHHKPYIEKLKVKTGGVTMKLYYGDDLIGSVTINHSASVDDAIDILKDDVCAYFGQPAGWDWRDMLDENDEFIYDYESFRVEW